jgi:class 3 adenylate cyclase
VEQKAVMQFMGRIADIPIEESADGREADRGMRSIMFTDLVGYTSMMSRLGDMRAFALLQKHNNVIRDALTKDAGREVKHTGDGIMASFDKADSALRAAIEIRGGVSAISVPGDEGTLSIRIGLTSGEPLQEGGDLFDTSVNLASRLCELADADEILLDDAFHGELSGTESEHELESIGSVTIRGFEEPVHVRRSVI